MARLTRRQFLGAAAGTAAAGAFPHVWIRPSWAQGKEIRILAWSHFVPAYDKWLDQWTDEWSSKSGIKAVIDHVPHLQIPAKIAAEVATQSGHDIVQLVGSGAEKWADALVQIQDLADKLGKKYGGLDAAGRELLAGQGRKVPHPARLLHRLSGALPEGPVDRCRHAERPGLVGGAPPGRDEAEGQGLPRRNRPRAPRRLASVLAGDHVVVRRLRGGQGRQDDHVQPKEMREALKFMRALYKDAMTPEVLAWDDASNNRLLASGRGSWIHNPISAYRSIEGQNKELAAKIFVSLSPKGPAVRRSFANCRAYGITKFSKNQDAAKTYLEALTDNYREGAKASTGYNMPMLQTFAKPPLPIISEDPKLKPLEQDADYHVTIGHPGTFTPAADEVYQQFIMVDALAQYCTDKLDLEAAVKWAEEKIKAVYAKFA